MSDRAFKAMSVEEYLRTEAQSPYKREYVGGFVYPLHGQAGASQEHSQITLNIATTLYKDARQAGCRLHAGEIKLYLDDRGSCFYPDVMVVCGSEAPDRYSETTPCLLVEILSPSTAAHDRVGKYAMYTAIPSLQTYLIVEQDVRRVYAYTRTAGGWQMQELIGTGEVALSCLGRTLTLDEIYDGVLKG